MNYTFERIGCVGYIDGIYCQKEAAYLIKYSSGGIEMDFEICKDHIALFRSLPGNYIIEPLDEKLKVMM